MRKQKFDLSGWCGKPSKKKLATLAKTRFHTPGNIGVTFSSFQLTELERARCLLWFFI